SHIKFLNKRGVGTSNVEISSAGKSFHWHARYSGAMNEAEVISTDLNILPFYNPRINDIAKKCEILFLANVDPPKQYEMITEAKGAKIVICDTMNYWIDTKPEELKKVLKRVNILLINEHEARNLTKETNIILALHKIVEMGPRTVVIKRGEYGSFVYSVGEKFFYVPAYPVTKVIDPTGAGDTFAGGFAGYLAICKNYSSFNEIKKAMLYGTVTASFMVEDFGHNRIAQVKLSDVKKRYKELLSMLTIK
ncbi:MAG: PfkB family carbohydrate kinase, partial [Proteobacteria bacterium]|nr:PfkB family carbohydrate kinase [Pseudomonadota bacterium]